MAILDDLKSIVNKLRESYGDFTKLDPATFPDQKVWDEQLTVQEATIIFEEQLQTIESALEDEVLCIRYVPINDIMDATNNLSEIDTWLRSADYASAVGYVRSMIPIARSFAMLSMERWTANGTEKLKI